MNRFRSRFHAVAALGLLLLAGSAGAGTIKVTTTTDDVANDSVCSIREAVTASDLAGQLARRTNSQGQEAAAKTALETALAAILEDPVNNSYPRGEMLALVQGMIDEVASYNVSDVNLAADLLAFQAEVLALPNNVGATLVQQAIALQVRVIDAAATEVERIKGLVAVDGCDDGTSFDVILLDANTTYYLKSQLDLSIRVKLTGGENSVITACDTTAHCSGATPAPHRLASIAEFAVIEVKSVIFQGGDAGSDGGGAIQVSATSTFENVKFIGNRARVGGALYVTDTGSLNMTDVEFTGNSAAEDGGAIAFLGDTLSITEGTFGRDLPGEGNVAGANVLDPLDQVPTAGKGGAIFISPAAGIASATLERVSMIGNGAGTGSAVYIEGTYSVLTLTNVTIANNKAGVQATIDVGTTVLGGLQMNNVTFVENTAKAGTAGLLVTGVTNVLVTNTVLAGNINTNTVGAAVPVDGDCDFGILAINDSDFRRNYYATGSACPGARWPTNKPEEDNYELQSGQTLIGYLLNARAAGAEFYVPFYPDDAADSTENRLVNRGAGTQDGVRCANEDQRSKTRATSFDTDCDIGSVEYQVGRRDDDTIEAFVDERVCFDVIGNDIGDANYVAGSLRIIPGGIERAGATAIVISRTPGSSPYADPVLDLDDVAVCPNQADIPYSEAILFTPAPTFRGETNVDYGLQWQTNAGPTAVIGDITAIAHVESDSRSGITSSSLGAGGPWFLLALLLLLARASALRRIVLAAGLVLAAGSASALDNIIYVNSGLDEPAATTPGDGLCTLREAIVTARNDQANLTGGDCLDGNEGPDIIEFTPAVTTVDLEDSLLAYGGITIRCPEPAAGDPPRICTIRRDPNTTRPFRLIDSRGSLALVRLRLEGGLTESVGTKTNGGAIFATGSLSITDSVFKDNTAVDGGAIFLGGTRASLSITGTTFEGNCSRLKSASALPLPPLPITVPAMTPPLKPVRAICWDRVVTGNDGGGGAIATSQGDDHGIQIQASTFVGNTSVSGAAVLDLSTASSVAIANSTFTGNMSAEGPGAIDVSGVRGSATLRNLTVVDNLSGLDQTLDGWETLPVTLPVQRAAIEVGKVAAVLTSSIVGANFDFATGMADANCGPGALSSAYNLFGDDDGIGLANVGSTCTGNVAHDLFLPATTVYNRATPVTGLLDYLQDVGAKTQMLPVNIAVEAGQIVDAGYQEASAPEENQVGPFELTAKCANVDQRGVSRLSGGACDRGAFEVLEITAGNDIASNSGRPDRIVLVDLLVNDLSDSVDQLTTNDIKQDCSVVDTSVSGVVTWRDVFGDACVDVFLGGATGTVSFLRSPADDAEIGFDTTSGYVLRYDNHGVLASDGVEGPVELTYRIYTNDQAHVSDIAKIKMFIDNLGPAAVPDTVHAAVGASATIDVLANDSDRDLVAPARLTVMNISGAGCNEVVDPDTLEIAYWQCQFGRLVLDAATGVITFTPDNSFNPFNQKFNYEISDNDPVSPKVASAEVTIVVDHEDVSGGGILGNNDLSDMLGIDFLGAPGNLFFVSLLLSLIRRRRK